MFQKEKTDTSELKLQLNKKLIELGVNTPTTDNVELEESVKIKKIEEHIRSCLDILGLDLSDDSLMETPSRIAKMWVKELFWGLDPNKFPKCTTVLNKMHYDEMVVCKDITVLSQCEHHFQTIDGVAHVSYIPKDKVLGLSKLNRIVEYYSRRPQIQERLTVQIGESLKHILDTDDVAVVINAIHYCVKSRGVEDQNSSTSTSFLSGKFRTEKETRKEFFDLIGK